MRPQGSGTEMAGRLTGVRALLPDRRTAVRLALTAAVLTGLALLAGADRPHAVALGVAGAIALRAVGAALANNDTGDLIWKVGEGPQRPGAREDVSELAWSIESAWGLVGRRAEIRVRRLARRRLALLGLNLENPADRAQIEARLGEEATQLVTRERVLGLRPATFCRLLDALDRLDSAGGHGR
jgi:hypothetical protein